MNTGIFQWRMQVRYKYLQNYRRPFKYICGIYMNTGIFQWRMQVRYKYLQNYRRPFTGLNQTKNDHI